MKRALLAVVVLATLGAAPSAGAAETKRVRVRVDSLPRQDKAISIVAKDAVLPDGARDGAPVPKSWKLNDDSAGAEFGHCTDDRRASVGNSVNNEASTEKIWEANGKVFFDRARVKVVDGKVEVVSAERIPVVYVTESVWAYRRESTIGLVFASDMGVFSRAIFYGCSVNETSVAYPTGSTSFESSPQRATDTLNLLAAPKKAAPWKGVAFTGLASVSKSSVDDAVMLNVVIQMP